MLSLFAAARRCHHKLVGGKWLPTPGEMGTAGRGGRNVGTAIAKRAASIMAGAEGRGLTSRESRSLDRLDRLALRRQAQQGTRAETKPASGARTVKPGESMGPAYDKAGRYHPARDPNVKSVAFVRSEIREKRKSERSRRRKG